MLWVCVGLERKKERERKNEIQSFFHASQLAAAHKFSRRNPVKDDKKHNIMPSTPLPFINDNYDDEDTVFVCCVRLLETTQRKVHLFNRIQVS